MTEETQTIQPKYGPYVGGHITVAKKIAKKAIADGWAVDPYAPPAEDAPYDEAKILAATNAANAAAAELRGEAPPPPVEAASAPATTTTTETAPPAEPATTETVEESKKKKPEDPLKRSMEAEARPTGGYETRSPKK
jgi:hypothetical protein